MTAAFPISLALSILALALSCTTLYLSWFHARRPRIVLLNDGDQQRSVFRKYDDLPGSIKHIFPGYPDPHDGNLIVRLVFANHGNHPGYAKICDAKVVAATGSDPVAADSPPWVSRYEYALVPARAVVDHVILVRNVPPLSKGTRELTVAVAIRTGGVTGVRGRLWQSAESQATLKILARTSRPTSSGGT